MLHKCKREKENSNYARYSYAETLDLSDVSHDIYGSFDFESTKKSLVWIITSNRIWNL